MPEQDQMYITGQNAMKSYASQTSDNDFFEAPKGKATAFHSNRTFKNHDTNISVRSDYNRADYDYFRPSDRTPKKQIEIIGMAGEAYQKVGLIRNVIDLMSDFGSQGIRLQHTTPSVQKFYESWWDKVQGAERSERFLNLLFRLGQSIIRKDYGKVSEYQERKMRKGVAREDIKLDKVKVNPREIPLKYSFINPLNLEILGEELSQFVGQPALGLKISSKLRNAIRQSGNKKLDPELKKLVRKIPKDTLESIKKGTNIIPLDMDKTDIYYYKKDDWSVWAYPMCYCVMDDLMMLNKLKLADISALDGAISNIRLWKLGIIGDSPANSILPTKTAINKLRNLLANNVGGGVLDLVWGPELTFEESSSEIWRWLGSEKYEVTINNIYEGMGIPAPLRTGSATTNTGNFVGLNTLVKRLKYGRNLLVDFWTKELKYIHKAMGFPGRPPVVVFDFMALADEAAEKQLLINMWDRNIISDETILELFGRESNVEKSRVSKEENERTNEKMPYKASPFHNPDKEHEYRKLLLQGGGVTPSEIGIDLNDRKDGEQTRLEQMSELDKQKQQAKEGGRPPNVTETQKRKPKPTEKPSTNAQFINTFLWANSAQETISDILIPSLLYSFGKKNLRSLSQKEFDMMENIKFGILCSFQPFEEITAEKIAQFLDENRRPSGEIIGIFKALKTQFKSGNNRDPKVDELRQMYASAYTLFYEE